MAKSGNIKDKTWGDINPSNQHMHRFQGSGDQTPGHSSQEGKGGRRDQAAPTGSKHGFYSNNEKHGKSMNMKAGSNTDYAGTQEAGTSGRTKTGPNNKFAEGGSTHMWGNRGSRRAVPGQSGCDG